MEDEEGETAYDNTHRAFLQAFLSRSTFTLPEAKPVLAALLSVREKREVLREDVSEVDFNNYVDSINAAISPYDLEIRSTFTQTAPRTRVYALVNTTSDPITQLATTHSVEEIAFINRVLDAMFVDANTSLREVMAIKSMEALRLAKPSRASDGNRRTSGAQGDEAGASPGMTGTQAEKVLQSMVDQGWFERYKEFYMLSPRALMELRGWLLETYNEPADEDDDQGVERIKLCQACREIVTVGQRCMTRSCKARLHEHCTRSLFRSQRGAEVCPLCKESWTGQMLVGPKAAQTAARSSDMVE